MKNQISQLPYILQTTKLFFHKKSLENDTRAGGIQTKEKMLSTRVSFLAWPFCFRMFYLFS